MADSEGHIIEIVEGHIRPPEGYNVRYLSMHAGKDCKKAGRQAEKIMQDVISSTMHKLKQFEIGEENIDKGPKEAAVMNTFTPGGDSVNHYIINNFARFLPLYPGSDYIYIMAKPDELSGDVIGSTPCTTAHWREFVIK